MRAKALFWSAAGLTCFVYAGYPLSLLLLRTLVRRPVLKRPVEPSISLVIAAHNEAAVIESKIRNGLALDYPADRLEVVVALDGPTDDTAQIVSRLADGQRVRMILYPRRRGKMAVLNDTLPCLRSEIVAFSDATAMLAPGALRHLVASFADPAVGAVSGVYQVTGSDEAVLGKSEELYWRYEGFLKAQESLLGSSIGAHGSLYAIRRSLYPFPLPDTVNDDFVIPMRILCEGYRTVYEPKAVAYEAAHEMAGFNRRVRIMAGNFQQLAAMMWLLWPPRPLGLFCCACHKVGRLLTPFALLILAACNLFLLRAGPYRWAFGLQLVLYGLALAGARWRLRPQLLRLPYYFCSINAATLVAASHLLRGKEHIAWN